MGHFPAFVNGIRNGYRLGTVRIIEIILALFSFSIMLFDPHVEAWKGNSAKYNRFIGIDYAQTFRKFDKFMVDNMEKSQNPGGNSSTQTRIDNVHFKDLVKRYESPHSLAPSGMIASDMSSKKQFPLFSSLFWRSWERRDYMYDIPEKSDSLQQVTGFKFCPQLNFAVFNADTRLDSIVADAILGEKDLLMSRKFGSFDQGSSADATNQKSINEDPKSLLYQLEKHRKYARMFSPLIDPDQVFPFKSASDTDSHGQSRFRIRRPWTSVRKLGHDQFVKIVDSIALAIYQAIRGESTAASAGLFDSRSSYYVEELLHKSSRFKRSPISKDDSAHRFACFMAADGNNDWNRLTIWKEKLMLYIEGRVYFDNEIGYDWIDMEMVNREARQISYQYSAYVSTGSVRHLNPLLERKTMNNISSNFGVQSNESDVWTKLQSSKHPKPKFTDFTNSNTPLSDRPRQEASKKHRLAYLILAHDSFENLVNLLAAILDRHVTILVHIDAKNPHLKERLLKFLESKCKYNSKSLYHRIKLMKKSFVGLWGHSSLVFAQLAGFFELLQLNQDWEYVINLSANDYPLRNNDVIYQDLKNNYSLDVDHPNSSYKKKKVPGIAFLRHYFSLHMELRFKGKPILSAEGVESSLSDRGVQITTSSGFTQPILDKRWSFNSENDPSSFNDSSYLKDSPVSQFYMSRKKQEALLSILHTKGNGNLKFPYSHWNLYKHDQWMILDRETVKFLKFSPTSMYIAAFSEFSYIPDECYFATLLRNNPLFPLGVVDDSKRYLEFPLASRHPKFLKSNDLDNVMKSVETDFVSWGRKVDVTKQGGWNFVRGIEKIRSWDWLRVFS